MEQFGHLFVHPGVRAAASAGLLLALAIPALAQAPQSDNFSGTAYQSFWKFQNIGDTGDFGKATVKDNQLTVEAGGADVWGTNDAMSYLYQPADGDFMFTVKVVGGLDAPADTYSKAGVMIRSSESDDAAYAYLFESPRRSGVLWEGRRTNGSSADFGEAPSAEQPPIWLRLVRIGGIITPFLSKDGTHFVQSGSSLDTNDTDTANNAKAAPDLKGKVVVGIAQTAHSTDTDKLPAVATYSDFTAAALPAAGTLSGSVLGADKKGTVASITFTSATTGLAFVATSDAEGKYTLKVPSGDYTVSADAVGSIFSGLPSAPVTVAANGTATVPDITSQLPPFFESTTASPYDDSFTGTTLDKKWTDKDIGDSQDGSAKPNNGKLEVTAGGHDIWDVADGFHFTYQRVPGDFAATLRVEAIPDNQDWELAGLMARVDDSDNSAYALNQISPRHQIQNKLRPTKGAASTNVDLDAATTLGSDILPAWVKIRRVGNKVAYYWTKDPATEPVYLGSVREVPAFGGASELLVGIAATSHDASVTDPGFIFSDFRVVPIGTSPNPVDIGDINGDKKVDIRDATLALRLAVGLDIPGTVNKTAGDVNGDQKTDIRDATLILRHAVGLETPGITFPF